MAGLESLALEVQSWARKENIYQLHPIQELAIDAVLGSAADLILMAPTAGGKTEAVFFPLISSLLRNPVRRGFDLVYVGPLKALINDQFGRLNDLCEETEVKVVPWHGDVAQSKKIGALKDPKGILLITPESLEASFVLRGPEMSRLFGHVRAVVIDELHALLDNERGIQLRSLLTRMEIAAGRTIRRIGLSATLGSKRLACAYLRPEEPETVQVLTSSKSYHLGVYLRAYTAQDGAAGEPMVSDPEDAAKWGVARHLYERLRGTSNLVFAGTRRNVEWYAVALRKLSKGQGEFFPHHANLSRAHRHDLEKRLKRGRVATIICTSTLELGIDIGSIASVGQIGPPFSVASLRQRLGRSGRKGDGGRLRMYCIGEVPGSEGHVLGRLQLDLVRSIAMIQLLLSAWCEPPRPQALHLSTLVHQIMALIAERGGLRAAQIYEVLCLRGPFRRVDQDLFIKVLRRLGSPSVDLLEQAPDGTLLLGQKGERMASHYSFYAVFQTTQEFSVVNTATGKTLGTLPVSGQIQEGERIMFAGTLWYISMLDELKKVIHVRPAKHGEAPPFGGSPGGSIHDRVVQEMRQVLRQSDAPSYLDDRGRELLASAQGAYKDLELDQYAILEVASKATILATWAGTVKTNTLGLYLESIGYKVRRYCGFLEVSGLEDHPPVSLVVENIASASPDSFQMLPRSPRRLMTEKYHPFLDTELLLYDAASSHFDLAALPDVARAVLEPGMDAPASQLPA